MLENAASCGPQICISRKSVLEELAVRGLLPALRSALGSEFPSVFVKLEDGGDPHVCADEWTRPDFDTWSFDVRIDELAREPFTLRIDSPQVALEVMNRCQRHVGRRNRHSQGSLFTRVLRMHRALHDLDKALVRADYNHAHDVWQWVLRLDPDASVSVQIAALFHDIERLVSESEQRVEHLADDYQSFKDAHASQGAAMTDALLAEAGVTANVRAEVARLITEHEHEAGLLADGDALSFFSLNSHGYIDYFGPEQTRKKVAYTLNRLRPAARAKLAMLRLRPDVRAMVE
jgi:Domain of unknown function (DUF4202)